MKQLTAAQWQANTKRRSSFKELVDRYMQNSEMFLSSSVNGLGSASFVAIRLRGDAARIPSLKNRKIPGLNVPNPDTMARIAVLDALYWRSAPPALTFGKERVHLTLISGARKVRYDIDNCFTTIRDWCEPAFKRVGKGKHRGWGVGLVANDSQISGIAIEAKDLGSLTADTFVVIRRWNEVARDVLEMIHRDEVLRDLVRGAK